MGLRFTRWIDDGITRWLTRDRAASETPTCDFDRLGYEVRPGDVLLVEGRSRVSEVIKLITQSPWTHSALYIGRVFDIRDSQLRDRVIRHYQGDLEDQLLIEALMGRGTVITPLSSYRQDHLRICRPHGLSPADAERVIGYGIERLGTDYDTRQLLDLARFMFPWGILPRRWRSSLFQHNAGAPTRTVCSSMLAEAFATVQFPVLPFIQQDKHGNTRFIHRNPRLFSPKDFDYSPYFDIIKYPFVAVGEVASYRKLPWDDAQLYNEPGLAPAPQWIGDLVSRTQAQQGTGPETSPATMADAGAERDTQTVDAPAPPVATPPTEVLAEHNTPEPGQTGSEPARQARPEAAASHWVRYIHPIFHRSTGVPASDPDRADHNTGHCAPPNREDAGEDVEQASKEAVKNVHNADNPVIESPSESPRHGTSTPPKETLS